MKIPQRTILLSTLVLLHTTGTATVDAFQYPRHAAAAVERRPQPFHKRQASMTGDPATVTGSVMTQGVTPTTYTVITPSPGMKPVAVTKQGQVVPTWAPLYTLCSLEPVASPIANGSAAFSYPAVGKPGATLSPMPIYPIPANMSNGTYPNPSGGNRLGTAPTPLPTANTTMNGTIVPPVSVTDQCRTVYSSTQTTVCATTVTGLATRIPVTKCDQLITYSTQYGYVQSVPAGISDVATLPATAQPGVQTLTTYWEARWQELSDGSPEHVTQKVCSTQTPYYQPGGMPNMQPSQGGERCVDMWQALRTSTSTFITSTVNTYDITTTIPGPSKLIIQTYHVTVTGQETDLMFSSSMVLQYSTESVVTSTETLGSSVSGEPSAATPGLAATAGTVMAQPTAIAAT